MKRINWRLFNLALWIELALSYILPFKVMDHFQYQVGFPIPFLSIYNVEIGLNPLMSMSFNPLAFLVNGILVYFMVSWAIAICRKLKHHNTHAS